MEQAASISDENEQVEVQACRLLVTARRKVKLKHTNYTYNCIETGSKYKYILTIRIT